MPIQLDSSVLKLKNDQTKQKTNEKTRFTIEKS